MTKISATNNKSLLIGFALKSILSSALSVIVLCAISSAVLLRLDIDLNIVNYLGVIICAVCSYITAIVSIVGFKNNYLLFSIFSVVPLFLYSLISSVINSVSFSFIAIKVALIVVMAIAAAFTITIRKRR